MITRKNFLIGSIFLSSFLIVGGCTGPTKETDTEQSEGCTRDTKYSKNDEQIGVSKVDTIPNYNVVNFYLENSKSMDGYVSDKTEFSDRIKEILYYVNVDVTKVDSTNLFYVNENILPIHKDSKGFIEGLNANTFVKEGGNRKSTDIARLLETIFSRYKEKSVSIIASDFIFSLAKDVQTKDVQKYLDGQKTDITYVIKGQLNRHPDLSIMVCRFTSMFNGYYYNKFDTKTKEKITLDRPFFIWFIGAKRDLMGIKRELNKKTKYTHIAFFSRENENAFDWRVKNGNNWSVVRGDKHALEDLEINDRINKCEFKISANLPLLLDKAYITNPANYTCDNGYKVSKVMVVNGQYEIYLQSDKVHKKLVTASLKNQLPSWVNQYNDEIGEDVTKAKDKTYGLSYLLNGVKDAFNQENYATFKIQIQ